MDFDLLDPPLPPLSPFLRANKPPCRRACKTAAGLWCLVSHSVFAGDFGSCCGRVVASAPRGLVVGDMRPLPGLGALLLAEACLMVAVAEVGPKYLSFAL